MSKKSFPCNLQILLDENPQTYYWIGFILADGHINKRNELKVVLSEIDCNHLLKLKKFLGLKRVHHRISNSGYKHVSITGMDTEVIKKLKNKFDIHNNKTKNPPNCLNKFYKKRDLFFALICGFIDGDGSIQKLKNRKDFSLTIKCHSSWLNNFKLFNNFLYEMVGLTGPEPIINNAGYARISITNSIVLKHIKKEAIKLGLPLLRRKWNNINLKFIGKTEKFDFIKHKTLNLLSQGFTNKEIKTQLNVSKAFVTQFAQNNNFVLIGREKGYKLKN